LKLILIGATGVLGSHIMYDILELFIKQNNNAKLFIIARNKGKVSAIDRVNELLTSDYTPQILRKSGLEKLHEYIEIIDSDLANLKDTFSEKIKGAYFIHSAGYVNLSTDENLKEKIFDENAKITKSLFKTFHPFIKKFIYIGTAFSSGIRGGLIDTDFHNMDFTPKHRNAFEDSKFYSENFIARVCKKF